MLQVVTLVTTILTSDHHEDKVDQVECRHLNYL